MSRSIWGPKLWYIIHNVAFNIIHVKNNIGIYHLRNFYYNVVPYIIPCLFCRYNYKNHISVNISPIFNKNTLFHWTVNIHNIVNSSIGKKNEYEITKYRNIDYKIYYWYINYLINQIKHGYIIKNKLMDFTNYLTIVLPNTKEKISFMLCLNKYRNKLKNLNNFESTMRLISKSFFVPILPKDLLLFKKQKIFYEQLKNVKHEQSRLKLLKSKQMKLFGNSKK